MDIKSTSISVAIPPYFFQELLAMQIASIHNLSFYLRLVTDARHHIEQGDFVAWKNSIIDQLGRRI